MSVHRPTNPFAAFRRWLGAHVERIPLWNELNAISNLIAFPIRLFAACCLWKFPQLKRWEWLCELQALLARAPITIALPVLISIWRGMRPTNLGHIGTDWALYPFIAGLSSFNPFLAAVCAVLFGIADFIQKLFINDMYGTSTPLDYWGALLGYVFAYSAVITAGLVPGISARVLRYVFVYVASRAWRADGAEQTEESSLTEDLVSMVGAYAGGAAAMNYFAPALESPAFYLRPHPDVSCFAAERAALQAMTAAVAGAAAFASLFRSGAMGAAVSLGLDLLPGIGTFKGFIQAITGKDLITGAKLNWWERGLGLVPFAAGASAIGREALSMFRLLSPAEVKILGKGLDGLSHLQPLTRTMSELGNMVHASPELKAIMTKLQSTEMAQLSVGVQKMRLGDLLELRVSIQEMMGSGRGVRQFQDVIFDKNGVLQKGADIVTEIGDVIQLKNYDGKNWVKNLSQAIQEQASSDFQRYGLNGWLDGAGRKLSGTFEFQFNARRLLREGVTPDDIERFARKMTNALQEKFGQYDLTHRVKPSF